jgi:uncharacterized protein
LDTLLDIVKKEIGNRQGAHGLDHFLRVRKIALKISKNENANKEIVEAMTLLHDLVRFEDEREEESVEETLKKAKKILLELDYSNEQITQILDGIETHSLHSKTKKEPISIEAKILFDADKIDSVGEIGLARWFMTMGNKNVSIKNSALIYLNTIKKQEEKMNSRLYTKTGTELIKRDLDFSKKFLNDLIIKID